MNKGARIFGKIIYYVFAFILGVMLAFTLPYFMYVSTAMRNITNWLHAGEYDKAITLIDGYHNRQYVYHEDLPGGGGIVLFEATTLSENSGDEEDETIDGDKLYKSYAGFIYGLDDYDYFTTKTNNTKLVVTDLDDTTHNLRLLSYDKDGNGTLDGIATAEQNDYIYLEIKQEEIASVKFLTFLDKDGNTYFKSKQLNLDFSGEFFKDVDDFVTEYNKDYHSSNLNRLNDEFLAKSENYAINTYGDLIKQSDAYATAIIVAYFVVIYLIGDLLLGKRYIIKFFRWFLFKVCKIKPKNKKNVSSEEVFGHDYYSSVSMSLDLSAVPDFNESVQVKYTNTDVEIVFILLKENDYTATERIKAGTYVNPFIDMNRDYAPTNLPDNLVVEGYKMDVKIKIIKREV